MEPNKHELCPGRLNESLTNNFGQLTIFINIYSAKKMKIAEFANSIDPELIINSIDLDEVAHYELPHLDLCCLPSGLNSLDKTCFEILQM